MVLSLAGGDAVSEKKKSRQSTDYKNQFNYSNYDSLRVVVPKGRKADIEAAIGKGKVNRRINELLCHDIGMSWEEWSIKEGAPDE